MRQVARIRVDAAVECLLVLWSGSAVDARAAMASDGGEEWLVGIDV